MKRFLFTQFVYIMVLLNCLLTAVIIAALLGVLFYYPLNWGILEYFEIKTITFLQLSLSFLIITIPIMIIACINAISTVNAQLKAGK